MDINKLKQDPEKIQQLIDLLGSLLPDKEQEPETTKKKTTKKKVTKKPRATSKKPDKQKSTNKFLDMPEMNMHKEDGKIDEKLQQFPPTPRSRPSVESISVRCRICGREENISQGLLFEGANRYKCNKCSTQSG
tara:strand:+ start:1107 stop:1508 length:402 start_codon:yes stop_codon:yes gene_type:complete